MPALRLERRCIEDLDAGSRLERLDHVGPHAIDHVDLAGPQGGGARRELRDEADRNFLYPRDARLPISGVSRELDAIAMGPAHEPEGSRTQRLLEERFLARARTR